MNAWLFGRAGLAMKQESEIEDNAGFFTRSNVQTPSEFCRTLRLQTPQENAELAAVALYAKMPKSAEIAECVRVRRVGENSRPIKTVDSLAA